MNEELAKGQKMSQKQYSIKITMVLFMNLIQIRLSMLSAHYHNGAFSTKIEFSMDKSLLHILYGNGLCVFRQYTQNGIIQIIQYCGSLVVVYSNIIGRHHVVMPWQKRTQFFFAYDQFYWAFNQGIWVYKVSINLFLYSEVIRLLIYSHKLLFTFWVTPLT